MAATDEALRKLIVQNRKARYDYTIIDVMEAGVMLVGTEVKSLRAGKVSIAEAHAGPMQGAFYLFNAHIARYELAGKFFQHEEKRPRKLLLRGREIEKLFGLAKREGISLIPLSMYFNERGIAKLELGLAKGKRKVDKRETEKNRDWDREKARVLRDKQRSND
ncbi:MAG: SsrA-binding protein SmpB [Alphaproteobacteria bacterium]